MYPGQVVADRFEIERLAASGGMGTVYRARDQKSGRLVALKVVRCDGPDDEMRFAREALVLADVEHTGIVRYVAHGFTGEGSSYLAMEWLDGEDLEARLTRTGITVADSVGLVRSVAAALAELHVRGVVHRDIKPSNLFLANGSLQQIKLLDFGIAQRRGATGSATRRGALMGTLGYMAPERVRGVAVDARADVFSLGCVLFECLSGRPAFAAAHMAAVLGKILFEEPPPVSELCEGVSLELQELVKRMLAKDAALRPADGAAVLAALSAVPSGAPAPRLNARSKMPSLTVEEMGLVCVIAVGDATVFEALDPPEVAELLAARLVDVAAPFGAKLEDLEGGLVLATLTGTANAADQAARSARCALAMRAALPGIPMAMTIGRGNIGGRLPIGAAIDRVIDLLREQALSDDIHIHGGTILVDDVTGRLLDSRFEVTGSAGGLGLQAEREVPLDAPRLLLGKPTPCFGRERELEALFALFEQCVSEPRALVVLATGAAGMGKSRLRFEFLRDIFRRGGPGTETWIARGDATSTGAPFGMVAQLVRHATGIEPADSVESRWEKLSACVARRVPIPNVPRVTEMLGELVGIKLPRDEPSDHGGPTSAPPHSDQIRRAFGEFVAAEAAPHPVLIVLEDLHWGDRLSIAFIDAALRVLRDRPLFVLALARTELHDLYPRLWVDRGVQEIRLEALSRRASERLARAVLGEAASKSTVERVAMQAGGNPLYLEELIRAAASGKSDALPETVLLMGQGLLASLEPEVRRMLRAASIFGDVFWTGGVCALLGDAELTPESEACLVMLVDREFIRPRPESAIAGSVEYAFRHALMREATLATLTAEDRALGHRLAGEWLMRAGSKDTLVLAGHFERGGAGKRAAALYRASAEQALGEGDFDAASDRAQRAATLGAGDDTFGAVRALQAEAHSRRGDVVETERYGLEAMELLPRESPAWFSAAEAVAGAAFARGDRGRLVGIADELCRADATEMWPRQIVAMAVVERHLARLGLGQKAERLGARLALVPDNLRRAAPISATLAVIDFFIKHNNLVSSIAAFTMGLYRHDVMRQREYLSTEEFNALLDESEKHFALMTSFLI